MPSIALTPMANFAFGGAVHRIFVRTTPQELTTAH